MSPPGIVSGASQLRCPPLCRLDALNDEGCAECSVALAGIETAVFVIREGDGIFAYRNHCPHTGVSLNWQPGRFRSADGDWIQCATHGALFGIDTGQCVAGPCRGSRLEALPIKVEHGVIYLDG